jgi:hypothetical protein
MRRTVSAFLILLVLSACTEQRSRQEAELELQLLMNEIDGMVANAECADPYEWRITPVGSKPCGGPIAYKAYSSQMDTVAFLQEVKLFTEKQRAFNKEWDVASDCLLVPMPVDVRCVEGKPELVYSFAGS